MKYNIKIVKVQFILCVKMSKTIAHNIDNLTNAVDKTLHIIYNTQYEVDNPQGLQTVIKKGEMQL